MQTFNVELVLRKQFVAEDREALEEAIKTWFARRKERDPKLNLHSWKVLGRFLKSS